MQSANFPEDAPPFLQDPALQQLPDFVHAFCHRHGGISPAPFTSCNISYGVGDAPAKVAENRNRLKTALGMPTLLSARQVHGNGVFVLDRALDRDLEVDGYDALISDQPGVALMVQQADCQAVLLADPVRRVAAICHNGWRGSVANIIAATVTAMSRHFASEPRDIYAAISPSLGPCCAEFVNFRRELPADFLPFQTRPAYFDFWAISRMQLTALGVPSANIRTAGICTCCNDNYFSYRRQRQTGRCGSMIGIRAPLTESRFT